VLTDVVPSKTLIATADGLDLVADSDGLGSRDAETGAPRNAGTVNVDLAAVNHRVRRLAAEHGADGRDRLSAADVGILQGHGRLAGSERVEVLDADGQVVDTCEADVVLLAVGARPRELKGSPSDGRRILTWTQLYELEELPSHLIVVGSGVTGDEFASAYR